MKDFLYATDDKIDDSPKQCNGCNKHYSKEYQSNAHPEQFNNYIHNEILPYILDYVKYIGFKKEMIL